MTWRMDVSVHIKTAKATGIAEITDRVRELVGRQEVDAGAGFGFRDMGFEFDSKEEADAAAKKIEDAMGKSTDVSVAEDPCADETDIQ